jgi:carbon starvation protein
MRANVIASVLMVGAWGYFLIQGVSDPLGGINSLWPLFGIANQMLAAIALCLATTIILKMMLSRRAGASPASESQLPRRPASASAWVIAITLLPLAWLLSATITAGAQKIWHSDPRIGFLAQARVLSEQRPGLEEALADAKAGRSHASIDDAEKAVRTNRVSRFNNLLDAAVAGTFLCLVIAIVLLSLREWVLLLTRQKPPRLLETAAHWLPDYAVAESKPVHLVGVIGLGLALAKELSGEAEIERQKVAAVECTSNETPRVAGGSNSRHYLEMTQRRFNGIRRCC